MYGPESIKKLLTRKFYIGRLEWQDKEYRGIHKPIIPLDLFYRVQDTLKRRSVNTGEKGELRFLLRGIAYCKFCSQKLTGEVHPRGSYYRRLPNLHKKKCTQPYIPVSFLDSQLEGLYARLQPPKKVLELLKQEIKEIADSRKRIAEKEVRGLKRTVEDIEQKELKLVDEMLAGKVARDIYEKMAGRYAREGVEAETRLSQLEVDYDHPLDFFDKCFMVSSMLLFLHQRFSFDQKKTLLKTVFDKIYV